MPIKKGAKRYRVDVYDKVENERYMRLHTRKRDAQRNANQIRRAADKAGARSRYSIRVQPCRTRKWTAADLDALAKSKR
jgi:hypothetical protein